MTRFRSIERNPPLPWGEGLGEWATKGQWATTIAKARHLRAHMTAAERLLWQALRNHHLHVYKFRRQHPIGHYIVDFYCHSARLVIVLDGEYHGTYLQTENDRARTSALHGLGLQVMRFENDRVIADISKVLLEISQRLIQSPR